MNSYANDSCQRMIPQTADRVRVSQLFALALSNRARSRPRVRARRISKSACPELNCATVEQEIGQLRVTQLDTPTFHGAVVYEEIHANGFLTRSSIRGRLVVHDGRCMARVVPGRPQTSAPRRPRYGFSAGNAYRDSCRAPRMAQLDNTNCSRGSLLGVWSHCSC